MVMIARAEKSKWNSSEEEEVLLAAKAQQMAHVLLFPAPAQGHIRAMLKLADLLHAAGFYITFVNTERNHRRFVQSSPISVRPKFRFRTIPDGLPDIGDGFIAVPDGLPQLSVPIFKFLELEESLRTCREYYKELLAPADGQDPDRWPRVTCVLADASLPFALEIAEESQVPVMIVATNSACSIMAHLAIPELVKRGEIPLPGHQFISLLTYQGRYLASLIP